LPHINVENMVFKELKKYIKENYGEGLWLAIENYMNYNGFPRTIKNLKYTLMEMLGGKDNPIYESIEHIIFKYNGGSYT